MKQSGSVTKTATVVSSEFLYLHVGHSSETPAGKKTTETQLNSKSGN